MSPTLSNSYRTYANLYVCILPGDAPEARCDERDGMLLAWTDWREACKAARGAMIVTNWEQFKARYLARLAARPPGLRIFADTPRGRTIWRAKIDAPTDELRELSGVKYERGSHARPERKGAMVWKEGEL
jgi:hypothetical protein